MSGGDVSKLMTAVKDGLHSEWANYKTTKKVPAKSVCIYAIGGQRDTPSAALASVSSGVVEWDLCLRTTVDVSVSPSRGVVSSEVMVGAEGQVVLFPQRGKTPSDPGLSTPSSSIVSSASKLPTHPRKKPVPPKTLLMQSVEQTGNYMIDHVKRVSEKAYIAGDIQTVILCLASAALVRSRLNAYKEILKQPVTKNLTNAVTRCGEVVEFLMQTTLSYTCDLLHNSLLHDAGSHNWLGVRVYEEGERASLTLQMWAYYIQGVRNDLWRHTSPRISESVLASILTDTLSLLVTRYAQIDPSEARLPQYRADIICILTIVASLLPSLVPSPAMLFSARLHESVALPLHRRADLLLKLAAIKAAPIEVVAKAFASGFERDANPGPQASKPHKNSNSGPQEDTTSEPQDANPNTPTHIDSTPMWLTFLNPVLFPAKKSSLAYVANPVATYLCLLTAGSRPQPQFPLIIRGLLMRGYLGAKTLLSGLQDAQGHVTTGEACGGPMCLSHLCTPPLIAHSVYAAIVQILVQCVDNYGVLSDLITPAIKQSACWDSLDRTQVWNVQRPPWHHALVQLVTPSVAGVVSEVLASVPPQPPARPAHPSQLSVRLEHHLSAWTLQLLAGVGVGASQDIPRPLLKVAAAINTALPPTVKPTGGHVITQLVVSSLYAVVNSRSSLDHLNGTAITDGQWDMMIAVGERLCSLHDGNYDTPLRHMTHSLLAHLDDLNGTAITDGQWDMMIAVGERLCSLHDGNYDTPLRHMTHSLLAQLESENSNEVEDSLDDYSDEDVIDSVCMSLANCVLSTVQGQHALVIVWEFLRRNMEWVQEALGVPSILPLSSQQQQQPTLLNFSPDPPFYNPLHYYTTIVYTRLDQESLINFQGDWELVLSSDLCLPSHTISSLISSRMEFLSDPKPTLSRPQNLAVKRLKHLMVVEADEEGDKV